MATSKTLPFDIDKDLDTLLAEEKPANKESYWIGKRIEIPIYGDVTFEEMMMAKALNADADPDMAFFEMQLNSAWILLKCRHSSDWTRDHVVKLASQGMRHVKALHEIWISETNGGKPYEQVLAEARGRDTQQAKTEPAPVQTVEDAKKNGASVTG